MKKILFVTCLVLPLLLMTAAVLSGTNDRQEVTVHEWGTFTSVAGEDGSPTPWQTWGGVEDLPCFVNSFGGEKAQLNRTVRMETPVLYFYSSKETSVDVGVHFPAGTITEWYPQRSPATKNASIAWLGVHLQPGASPDFPTGKEHSHYYAARETDATPLQVGSDKEKFLFYRGIGTFPLPLSARMTAEGNIVAKSVDGNAVDGVLEFENRGGKIRYSLLGTVHGEITINRQRKLRQLADLFKDLERVLIDQGLYPKEAHAMIETWRDSWFEEGARLLYIMPKKTVDSVLALGIRPEPAQIERVFVGRIEIITPEIQEDVRAAIASNNREPLEKYGRFLQVIAKRIGAKSQLLDAVSSSYFANARKCSK